MTEQKDTTFLCDIPRGCKIFCECSDGSKYIEFLHLDGMYSFCKTEKGKTVHVGALQQLKETIGGYELA